MTVVFWKINKKVIMICMNNWLFLENSVKINWLSEYTYINAIRFKLREQVLDWIYKRETLIINPVTVIFTLY